MSNDGSGYRSSAGERHAQEFMARKLKGALDGHGTAVPVDWGRLGGGVGDSADSGDRDREMAAVSQRRMINIQTVIPIGEAKCKRCQAQIVGTAKRICLASGAHVYCESCAEKGMANLERFMNKLYLPDAEFEAWLQED